MKVELSEKDYIEIPVEILRMKESGKTLFGKNIINDIDTPTRDDMFESFSLAKELNETIKKTDPAFAKQYKQNIENPTIRLMSQIVITGAMRDYYFFTSKSCSNKLEIIDKMKQNIPDYQFLKLLALCVKWRYHPDLITPETEIFMREQYQQWQLIRSGKAIDFVPLLRFQ